MAGSEGLFQRNLISIYQRLGFPYIADTSDFNSKDTFHNIQPL